MWCSTARSNTRSALEPGSPVAAAWPWAKTRWARPPALSRAAVSISWLKSIPVTVAAPRSSQAWLQVATAAAGNLPDATCGQRVQTLAEKAAGLRDRRTELTLTPDAAAEEGPTEAELDVLSSKIRDVIADGDTGAQ